MNAVLFALVICLSIGVPMTVMAWAMKKTHCPECGAAVGPDADIQRAIGL
jgi:hypothetical protein